MDQNKPFLFTSPRNFKQGRLIMNRFRLSDLIMLIFGAVFSFLGVIIYIGFLNRFNIWIILLLLLPAVITYFLTTLHFAFSNKRYIWEGIYKHDSIEEK
mgnify:CR=1 FL=1